MLAFTQEKMMPTVLMEQCTEPAEDASSANTPKKSLFVATSLATWSTANPQWFARDFQINDTVYRRLDPEYYAWLRSRMVFAKKAASAGQFPPSAFENLRLRFNAVHEWAVGHFGEAALLAAARGFRSSGYDPPAVDDEGRHVPLPAARKSAGEHIPEEAITVVDGIAECAQSLGWKRERLYGIESGSIFDQRRGLVSHLMLGDRIGEVTLQSIEIVRAEPVEVRHRFYNPDVDQPWVKRIDVEKK